MATTEETLAVAAATRARLASATLAQEVAITRAWVEAWERVMPEIRDSLADILARYQAGDRIPRSVIARDVRLRAALRQIRDTLRALAEDTTDSVARATQTEVALAAPDLARLAGTQVPPGVTLPVTLPAPDALDAIVTRTAQRVHSQNWALGSWAEKRMKQELVRGIAVGENPRRTARRMLAGAEGRFDGGLGRALTIARTETLDAYRAASTHAAKANADLLAGRRWAAKLDARTCPSCIGLHGRMFPVDADGPQDHPNGRCAFIDVTKSWADLGFDGIEEPEPVWEDRDEWWDNLDERTQRTILGPARADLLAAGDVRWEDLTHLTDNPGWRPAFGVKPLGQLHGAH